MSALGRRSGSSSWPWTPVASAAGGHNDVDVEALEPARGLLAEIPGADDQHALAGQLVGVAVVLPRVIGLLGPYVARQITQRGEGRGQHPLGDRATVHTAGVAQGHAVRDQRQHRIDAGADGLDDTQGRQPSHDLLRVGPAGQVRQWCPELGLGQPRRLARPTVPDDHRHPGRQRADEVDGMGVGQADHGHASSLREASQRPRLVRAMTVRPPAWRPRGRGRT